MISTLIKTNNRKIAVLALVTFLCFINVVKNGYSLDDQMVTTAEHALVSKGLGGIKEIFTSNYSSVAGKSFEYRPIAILTFAIEYQIWGFNPALSHLVNLLLYILLVILVFQVLVRLLPSQVEAAFGISLIFALHPLHNEVVVSLKNREEILVAIFGFLCFRSLLIHLQTNQKKALLASCLFFLLGSFTKLTIDPFAFLVVFSAWYFGKGSVKKLSIVFGIYFLLMQLFYWTGYAFLSNGFHRTFDEIENPLTQVAFFDRIPAALAILVQYIKLFIWPNPLISYYGLGAVPIAGWSDVYFFVGLFIVVCAIVVFVKQVKSRSLLGYGIVIFLFLLATYLNFPVLAPGIMAERLAFLAVLGFSVMVIALANSYLRQQQVQLGLIVLSVVYILVNINRTPEWKSLTSLLEADTQKGVTSVKLFNALAENYHTLAGKETNNEQLRANYLKKAEEGYLKVIKIYPEHGGVYNNLGTLYASIGKFSEAETCLVKAIQLGYTSADAYYNLGAICELSGKYDLAKQYYYKCLSVNSGYVQASERLMVIAQQEQISTKK